MKERTFRQRHPVFAGLLLLGGLFLAVWGILAILVSFLVKPSKDGFFLAQDCVGIIDLKGVIVSSDEIIKDLIDFQHNDKVKAIVLRIDSPGGVVGASQEIFREVKRTNGIKPIVASMGSISASGAYYASIGAQKILASPGTLTGSVGVIIKFANLEELFEKIGYKSEIVKSGKLKDTGSSSRPLSKEEREVLQSLIDTVHRQFVNDIAENRALSVEQVDKLADGRIYSGEQAKALGLIDQFGNLTDAVKLAASLGGIDDDNPKLLYPKQKNSFLKYLSGEMSGSIRETLRPSSFLSYEWNLTR